MCHDVRLVSAATHSSVRNLAVGGSLSHQTVTEVEKEQHAGADAIVLMVGLNDARLYGEQATALTGYETALAGMFTNFARRSPRARVIAVEQPPLLDYNQHAPFDNGSDALIERYNRCLRKVAAGFLPVQIARPADWDPARMLAPDSVHPNDLGHHTIARAVIHVWLERIHAEQRVKIPEELLPPATFRSATWIGDI